MVDKVMQGWFVDNVYFNRGYDKESTPPDLRYFVLMAVIIDAIICSFMFAILASLSSYISNSRQNAGLDMQVVKMLSMDYMVGTLVIGLMGVAVANQVQNDKLLRYRDMGLRGIRAFGELFLYAAAIIIVVPYYRVRL